MSQKRKNASSHQHGQVERLQDSGTIRAQLISQSIEGPLPAPALLADYDRVHPGLAKIIVDSFQNETAHRHQIENKAMAIEEKVSTAFVEERRRGQRFGLAIAIMLVAGTITLGVLGQGWAATVLGGVGFASIVGAFVVGRRPPEPPAESKKAPKK